MAIEGKSAGDTIPPHFEIIEVRVKDFQQLFNAIDPSPFHERDLDPNAEEFIANWAGEIRGSAQIGLVVHLGRLPGAPDEADILRDAVRQNFHRRSLASRRRLRVLFQRGRISLVIGLTFLAVTSWLANALAGAADGGGFTSILGKSLIIGGWVAMWRPMEVFLYDWWPIRVEQKRNDRLAVMPVRIQYVAEGSPSA